jgi:hypothetical protein
MKLTYGKWFIGIEWDESPIRKDDYYSHIILAKLPFKYRYWGYSETYYDGPWYSFGLGVFNLQWRF